MGGLFLGCHSHKDYHKETRPRIDNPETDAAEGKVLEKDHCTENEKSKIRDVTQRPQENNVTRGEAFVVKLLALK